MCFARLTRNYIKNVSIVGPVIRRHAQQEDLKEKDTTVIASYTFSIAYLTGKNLAVNSESPWNKAMNSLQLIV